MTLTWLPVLAATLAAALAQEEPIPPERASKPPVAITFTPPDLEGEIDAGFKPKSQVVTGWKAKGAGTVIPL